MLTYGNKVEIYTRRQTGETINSISSRFKVHKSDIKYLIRLIDYHGLEIVKPTKRKIYSNEFKEQAINRILIDGDSIKSVAIELGLSCDKILRTWVKYYLQNGNTLKKDNKGCFSMKKTIKATNTPKSTEEQLKEENLYLKAENEYLKKLKALAQNSKK
ncbi:hypothetical protein AN643_00320 [Candidatus Epulonipiscioides saccharophilum]|nr:hypothetical protein AN643_00320 [Epulopiscium sp. SCG-B10WGA-EpuloB]